jgi:hypothetical protein
VKKTFILVGTAGVLVIVAVTTFVLFSKLDSLIASAIERSGSHVTGTNVSVASVDIGIKEGRGSITGLAVTNPDGFTKREAFELGEVTLDVDVQSIRSQDPIVIEVIRVSAPRVLFELDKNGKSNVDAIRKHAEAVIASVSGGGDSSKNDDSPPILIRSIQFKAGLIQGDASAVGIDPFEVNLPSFTLTNVGGPKGGQPAELGKTIIAALARKAAEAVARDKAADVVETTLKDALGKKTKDLINSVR